MSAEGGTAEIPFDVNRQLIRVTGKINGHDVTLNLDTGFPYDGILLFKSPQVATLGLPFAGQIRVGGAGGSGFAVANMALGQTIEFPGINLTEQAVTVMPQDSVRDRIILELNSRFRDGW